MKPRAIKEPAFAAALPTADLQEEVERLEADLKVLDRIAYVRPMKLYKIAYDAIAIARRLAQPAGSRPEDAGLTETDLTLLGATLFLAWEAGELSEGQVASVLKTDRLTCRIQRDAMIQRGLAAFATLKAGLKGELPEPKS